MRYAVAASIIICFIITSAIVAVVIVRVCVGDPVDWVGIAAVIGAMATMITGVTGMKAIQKKHEKEPYNINPNNIVHNNDIV